MFSAATEVDSHGVACAKVGSTASVEDRPPSNDENSFQTTVSFDASSSMSALSSIADCVDGLEFDLSSLVSSGSPDVADCSHVIDVVDVLRGEAKLPLRPMRNSCKLFA